MSILCRLRVFAPFPYFSPDMWPLFNRKNPGGAFEAANEPSRKQLSLGDLMKGMGDLDVLWTNDTAMKFWLPEPAEQALVELSKLQGDSMSEVLREFLTAHCYGVYAMQLLRTRKPEPALDSGVRFSPARAAAHERKVRKVTYWVPELGKNVAPVKIWIAKRLRDDLQALAEHTRIPLSQYVREIVVSRLLGHGMLPKRPEMLEAAPLPSADAWCEDREVPWVEVDEATYLKSPEGRKDIEWEDGR